MIRTGELSRLFGIDRTTLNYYVKKGLIRAESGENQYHTYSFEDCMALSFIRYFRGLGFGTDEVAQLLSEKDHAGKLESLRARQEETEKQIQALQLRYCFLKNMEELYSFLAAYGGEPVRITTEPYYYIWKTVMENEPDWMELYRAAPSVEFSPRYNAETELVEIPDLSVFSGISMKVSWLEKFSLTPPAGSTFHPAQEKYVMAWRVSGETPERELSEKIRELFKRMPEKLEEEFVLYLLPSLYKSEHSGFDALCFFSIKP